MDVPIVRTGVEKWQGQVSNASPHQLSPGAAQSQLNCRTNVLGQLDVRPGVQPVEFNNGVASATTNVIALSFYDADLQDYLIYQTDDGKIKAGANPSLP
jgi:hypothetical protein